MPKKRKIEQPALRAVNGEHRERLLNHFFAYCPNQLGISDIIATLATHQLVTANNVPPELLPHVLFLHCIAPEPGFVDDIQMLVAMIDEQYTNPHHGARFWHPEGFLVGRLIYGQTDPSDLGDVPDVQYMYDLYEELTNETAHEKMFAWTNGHAARPTRKTKKHGAAQR